MQDQAFLGPESGLAVPDGEGGVDLHVATQWLHADQDQICAALGLTPAQVRLTLAGVGGAFGGREDLSMHDPRLPARAAHRAADEDGLQPRGVVLRSRAPAPRVTGVRVRGRPATADWSMRRPRSIWTEVPTPRARVRLSATPARSRLGPYVIPSIRMDCYGVYTNNPPCGAMRGFGAVQAAFAYEAMMDKLATALHMDPVELRVLNAMSEGSHAATGQLIDSAAPVAELLERVRDLPLPPVAMSRDPGRAWGRSTSAGCPAESPIPPTARASGVASATESGSRTSGSPWASTTSRRPECASRWWEPSRR